MVEQENPIKIVRVFFSGDYHHTVVTYEEPQHLFGPNHLHTVQQQRLKGAYVDLCAVFG